ncbi:metallophosphoesterase family protein [Virgibacillus flavescens]|uniref:metallophosphoesterase family protein n=1 Tax=Virgibacillus flavescens TaxID=1611422 RepID=UPI003D343250
MSEQLSFIHAADLHLDSPFQGLVSVPEKIFKQIQSSTFDALDNLIQTAITKKVDFVLLVGDLFDNERQSLRAQIKLKKAFEELHTHDIDVYLSFGNHDFISGNPYPVKYPNNVYIFNEESVSHFTFKKEGNPSANIYGFSYESRSVLQNKSEEFIVHNPEIPFHIAMLHGSLYSNTEHDTYAPFYISELADKDFDYWALGHIHQREIVKETPPIIYPGNIQGRNRKESGSKGCYHVTLTKNNVNTTYIPTRSLEFNTLHVDVSNCSAPYEMEELIQHALERQRYDIPQLLTLEIVGSNSSLTIWERDGLIDEVIDLFNETSIESQCWNFIFRFQVNVQPNYNELELKKGNHFIGELLRRSDDASIHTYTEEIYRHKQARKYIHSITKNNEDYVRRQAKELLLNELLKGED